MKRKKEDKKFFRNKGVSTIMNNTMLAILALATIVILSMFAFKAYNNFKEQMSVANCRDSIAAHSTIAKLTARDMFTDIKCPTNEITIKNNKEAKEIIAEDIHRCWYIWGQGKGQYFEGEGNFCHICGIYQFGDKGQKIDGFVNYLSTQEIKVKYPGDTPGISYQDYLQGYTTPNSVKFADVQPEDITKNDYLNTSQRYATIFMYASGKDAIDLALENGGRASTAVGGGLVFLAGSAAAVGGTYAAIGVVSAIIAGSTTVGVANIWNPVGWIVLGVTGITAGVYALYKVLNPGEPEWVSFVVFRPYNVTEFKNMSCDKLYVNQMSNSG